MKFKIVLGLVWLIQSVGFADIGLVFKNNTRAVVYFDSSTQKVTFRYCDAADDGSFLLDRHCTSKVSSQFDRSYTDYLTNVHQLYKIDSRFQGPKAITAINQEIESYHRDLLNSDALTSNGKAVLEQELAGLEQTQKQLLAIQKWVEYHLNFSPEANLVYREGIHAPFPYILYAFHTVWYDGQNLIWRYGSGSQSWSTRAAPCVAPWKVPTLSQFQKMINDKSTSQLLALSPIGKLIGSQVVWAEAVPFDFVVEYSEGAGGVHLSADLIPKDTVNGWGVNYGVLTYGPGIQVDWDNTYKNSYATVCVANSLAD